MQNNLGYFFYKRLYNVSNAGLTINSQNKKLLLDRTINEQEKKYAIESPDFIKLYTTYPGLATGTGMPHGVKDQNDDFKIGFYFDYTTGLPLLPGSSVKGVLRSAFPDIKKNIMDDGTVEFVFEKRTNAETNCVKACWIQALLNGLNKDALKEDYYEPVESVTPEQIESLYALVMAIFEGVKDHTKSDPREKYYSIYQRDIFHDAIITGAGKQEKIVGTDSITPHIREGEPYHKAILKNPTPLLFLKVLPNVEFSFNFSLTDSGLPKDEKLKLFKHILLTIGVGAKTNVGYGQFTDKLESKAPAANTGTKTSAQGKPVIIKTHTQPPSPKQVQLPQPISIEKLKPNHDKVLGEVVGNADGYLNFKLNVAGNYLVAPMKYASSSDYAIGSSAVLSVAWKGSEKGNTVIKVSNPTWV